MFLHSYLHTRRFAKTGIKHKQGDGMKFSRFVLVGFLAISASNSAFAVEIPDKPFCQRYQDREVGQYVKSDEASHSLISGLCTTLTDVANVYDAFAISEGKSMEDYYFPESLSPEKRYEYFQQKIQDVGSTEKYGVLLGAYYSIIFDNTTNIPRDVRIKKFKENIQNAAIECELRAAYLYTSKEAKKIIEYEKYPNCFQDHINMLRRPF